MNVPIVFFFIVYNRHVQKLELNYYFVLRGLKPLEMSVSCQMRHKILIYTMSFLCIARQKYSNNNTIK